MILSSTFECAHAGGVLIYDHVFTCSLLKVLFMVLRVLFMLLKVLSARPSPVDDKQRTKGRRPATVFRGRILLNFSEVSNQNNLKRNLSYTSISVNRLLLDVNLRPEAVFHQGCLCSSILRNFLQNFLCRLGKNCGTGVTASN